MKLLPLISLLLILAAGCSRHDVPPAAAPSLPPVKVRIAVAEGVDSPRFTEVTGTVRPVRRAVLAATVIGAITELPVTLGQRVRRGDVLLRIHSGEANAKLIRARAELNAARRDLERERDLKAKGASTAETVRNLEDRFTGYEAMVREAEAQLSYTELRSPFDGVVARKLVNAGDLANPGQPLIEVEETDNFEVEASIPESLAPTLKVGTEFRSEAGGAGFTGRVKEISSMADAATRSIGVKIAVPAGTAVRSGQFARLQVPGPPIRTVLVPAAAVSLNGQMERVFVVGADGGNRAVLRIVRTGAAHGDRVEILSGLAENERVVVAPPAGFRDGQPLEILP